MIDYIEIDFKPFGLDFISRIGIGEVAEGNLGEGSARSIAKYDLLYGVKFPYF